MNWKKELELLRDKQGDDEAGNMICDEVKEVMTLIDNQGHSGCSYSILSNILIRLLKEKPLFPITDNPSEWGTDADEKQNNRVSSIFKYPDGTIHDVERTIFVDTYDNKNTTWNSGLARDLVDEMFPLKLPYMPSDNKYYVYGKHMFLDENGNDKTNENIGTYNYTKLEYIIE